LYRVFLILTVDVAVVGLAIGLVRARLVQRAAFQTDNAVTLGVAHVGLADTAAVRAQELVNTSAVLTWNEVQASRVKNEKSDVEGNEKSKMERRKDEIQENEMKYTTEEERKQVRKGMHSARIMALSPRFDFM
jgi:hypothetical protein